MGAEKKDTNMVRKIIKGDPLWGAGGWVGSRVRGSLWGREGKGWGKGQGWERIGLGSGGGVRVGVGVRG